MIVAVAGMHRSGTSLLAGYLDRSGIRMGRELYVDRTTNPYGHFEDLDFLSLQREEIARAFGGEDYVVTGRFTPSDRFRQRAGQLLRAREEAGGGQPWGWKDPRTTLFLDHWRSLAPDLQVVAPVRPPRLVTNSLCARLGAYYSARKKDLFLRTYTHYNSELLRHALVHPGRTHVIALDRLLAEPRRVLPRLGEVLNHPCSAEAFEDFYDAKVISRPRRALLLFNRTALRVAEGVYLRLLELAP